MTTAEATLDIGSIDATTGALNWVAELERAVRKSAVLKRVSRVLKLVPLVLLLTLLLILVNVLDLWLLLIMGIAHWKTQRLTSYMNQAAFDGDEGLAELKRIARRCGDLVQRLDGSYGQRRRLGRRWPRLPLNGLVLHQLENLTCEVEDIGETAALSASPEIRASIMEQLAAHGIVSSDDL